MYTMGDICLESIKNEDKLFKLFGVNAELLIDHAWGIEPCTLSDIKNYTPENNSLSSGQVLHEAYNKTKTRIIVREMVDNLVLDMINKNYVCDTIILTIGYDIENINNGYNGVIKKDYYGRSVPKEAHGTKKIDHFTASTKVITEYVINLFNEIVDDKLLIRRINLVFYNLKNSDEINKFKNMIQLDLFNNKEIDLSSEIDEMKVQRTIINIKNKYGKNAILKGIDLVPGATTRERNNEIGGHSA